MKLQILSRVPPVTAFIIRGCKGKAPGKLPVVNVRNGAGDVCPRKQANVLADLNRASMVLKASGSLSVSLRVDLSEKLAGICNAVRIDAHRLPADAASHRIMCDDRMAYKKARELTRDERTKLNDVYLAALADYPQAISEDSGSRDANTIRILAIGKVLLQAESIYGSTRDGSLRPGAEASMKQRLGGGATSWIRSLTH